MRKTNKLLNLKLALYLHLLKLEVDLSDDDYNLLISLQENNQVRKHIDELMSTYWGGGI
jgi:hypothetical protein